MNTKAVHTYETALSAENESGMVPVSRLFGKVSVLCVATNKTSNDTMLLNISTETASGFHTLTRTLSYSHTYVQNVIGTARATHDAEPVVHTRVTAKRRLAPAESAAPRGTASRGIQIQQCSSFLRRHRALGEVAGVQGQAEDK
jgi:hypothetical protein